MTEVFNAFRNGNERCSHTHVAVLVGDVVGQFQLVKRDHLLHPLFPRRRRVGVDVHTFRHLRVGLTGHHPTAVVKFVAAIIHRNDIHQHNVLRALVESRNFALKWREHAPAEQKEAVIKGPACHVV